MSFEPSPPASAVQSISQTTSRFSSDNPPSRKISNEFTQSAEALTTRNTQASRLIEDTTSRSSFNVVPELKTNIYASKILELDTYEILEEDQNIPKQAQTTNTKKKYLFIKLIKKLLTT